MAPRTEGHLPLKGWEPCNTTEKEKSRGSRDRSKKGGGGGGVGGGGFVLGRLGKGEERKTNVVDRVRDAVPWNSRPRTEKRGGRENRKRICGCF